VRAQRRPCAGAGCNRAERSAPIASRGDRAPGPKRSTTPTAPPPPEDASKPSPPSAGATPRARDRGGRRPLRARWSRGPEPVGEADGPPAEGVLGIDPQLAGQRDRREEELPIAASQVATRGGRGRCVAGQGAGGGRRTRLWPVEPLPARGVARAGDQSAPRSALAGASAARAASASTPSRSSSEPRQRWGLVETDPGGPLLHPLRESERRQGVGDALQEGEALRFSMRFSFSQLTTTSSAPATVVVPKTWGWRWTILARVVSATSPMSKPSGARRRWRSASTPGGGGHPAPRGGWPSPASRSPPGSRRSPRGGTGGGICGSARGPGAAAGRPQPLDDLIELAQRLRRLLTHRNLLRRSAERRGGPLHPPWIPSPPILPRSRGHGLAGPGQPAKLPQHPQEHILPLRVGRPPAEGGSRRGSARFRRTPGTGGPPPRGPAHGPRGAGSRHPPAPRRRARRRCRGEPRARLAAPGLHRLGPCGDGEQPHPQREDERLRLRWHRSEAVGEPPRPPLQLGLGDAGGRSW